MKLPHTSLEGKHLPVMVDEVLKICNPKSGQYFMDCTFGAGGYSKEFLKFKSTKVVALDRDDHVIEIANKFKDEFKSRFTFYNNKFSNLDQVSSYKYDAVNLTLGLNYLRLSPDHGVAIDLIGKNKANASSLIECINFLNKSHK